MKLLLSAKADTGSSSVANIREKYRAASAGRAVQVTITGTSATVKLEGRLHADAPWVQLGSDFTASGIQWIKLTPQIRLTVSAIDSATVDGAVDALG